MILTFAKKCNLPKLAQDIRTAHSLVMRYDGFSTNERLDGELVQDSVNTLVVLHEADVAHNPQIKGNAISPELQAAIESTVTAHTP